MSWAIEAKGLCVRVGPEKSILQDIHLQVPSGQRVGIVGPNGVGKTTLLTTLATLRRRGVEGELFLFGKPAGPNEPEARLIPLRRRLGFVFQQAYVALQETCYENVSMMAAIRGVPWSRRREAVQNALQWVGLQDRQRERAWRLNGGDKQLLAIAQAIVGISAGILFADEPAAHLSPEAADRIRKVLCRLSVNGGFTIMVVSHHWEWLQGFAQRIYILQPADRWAGGGVGGARLVAWDRQDGAGVAGGLPPQTDCCSNIHHPKGRLCQPRS